MNLSPIVAVEASGPGALPGFESRCSCGLVLRSSLRTVLEADRVAHADWHARQPASRVSYSGNGVWLAETRHPTGGYMVAQGTYYTEAAARRAAQVVA